MTIKELDQRLTLVLEDFSSEMRSEYDDYSNEPVTGGDIAQLSRQTFYALDEFRKEIIKYLIKVERNETCSLPWTFSVQKQVTK